MSEAAETCLTSYTYNFDKNILRDKVAFITGGGSGICFRIAEIFMRHGCKTAIGGRKIDRLQLSAKTLEKSTGQQCLTVQMDVRKPSDVITAVDKCLAEFGRIDILINGAAGNFLCPLESLSYNGFKTVIDIDTLGTFNTSKAVFDKYFKENGGVIINITATLHHRGVILQAHAGAAKAAIEYLTRHQAVEWGRKGVRVNCVAPGPIQGTEGMSRLGGGVSLDNIAERVPLKRIGTKQEIGETCLFLSTNMASYITGTTLIVDGGAWMGGADVEARLDMYKTLAAKL